jgi:hypothetical protein
MNSEDKFETWETIKSFYREKFGTAPEMVELAPVLDLLRLCASGASNKSIANFFNESEEGLMELFDAHLGFMGWKQDLSFSPLKLYKELDKPDGQTFADAIILKHGYKLNIDLGHMYESARLVERLERLFDETWI